MIGQLFSLAGRFRGNERGTVAIIFAAVLIPIVGIAASAIDLGRASKVRMTLERAAESAAQAASHHLDGGEDTLRRLVRTQLDANLPVALHEVPFGMIVPADRSSVEILMDTRVPTTLMGVIGVQSLEVRASGFARRPMRQEPVAEPAAEPSLASAAPSGGTPSGPPKRAARELPPEVQRILEQQRHALEQLQEELRKGGAELPPELGRILRAAQGL